MNFDFYMPVRVVSGRTALADSAAQLKKLGDSCMVVTGKHSAKASGALDDLTEVLRREKISCTVYDGITENPLLSSCEEAAALAAEKETIFTKEEGAALLEEYLMEGRELAEFSVSDGVSVVFRDAEHRETAYTFDEGYLSKEISVYEKHPGRNWDCVAIYKNLNGNYEKVDGIPQWFSWRQLRNEA